MPKKKIYAVATGRKPGLYETWGGPDGAEEQVKGFPGAVYKSFPTSAEATTWFNAVAGGAPPYVSQKRQTPTSKRNIQNDSPLNAYDLRQIEALKAGKTVIYTDGGCEGNPGKGGYGLVIINPQKRQELSGGYARTTNNRMELMACIVGLRNLDPGVSVVLFSDSSYVVNGIEKGWAVRWRRNGWMRRQDQELVPAKNADLWRQLLDLCDRYDVEFMKVKGHAGVPENERCDELSTEMIQRKDLPADTGYME